MREAFPLDALSLDRSRVEPLHRQVYQALSDLIRDRTLAAGSTLPSTRSLASDLAVSRNTVVAAYEQLATEGYLSNRAGACPTVVDLPPIPDVQERLPSKVSSGQLSRRGELMMRQPVHHGRPGQVAFHPGMPDAEHFPFGIWSRLLARRANAAGGALFGTYDVPGLPALRKALASYLRTARGVRCSPEQIVVTTGAQAAFDLWARLLVDQGESVWMEEPGYIGAQSAFVCAGARLEPLNVSSEGWQLDPPATRPRLVYTTPACHHPLGVTMRME